MGGCATKVQPEDTHPSKTIRATAQCTHASIGMTDRQYEVKFPKDIAGKSTWGIVRDGTFETRPLVIRWRRLPPGQLVDITVQQDALAPSIDYLHIISFKLVS